MAGQRYGFPTHLHNNTHESDPLRLQAGYQQQAYGLDFPSSVNSSIKYESNHSKEDTTRWSNVRYESPTKRQKVEEASSEVKFVTQTKWKFPESQKWIEVQQTPSTQARNAARASREAENTALLQARQKENRNNAHNRNASDIQMSKLSNGEELKDAHSVSENMRSRLVSQGNTSKPTPKSSAEASVNSLPANTSNRQQQEQRDTNVVTYPSYIGPSAQQIYSASKSTTIVNGIEIGPTHVAPKTVSLSDRALSLEKDADRIAALIAEKRLTNEATMFRQKMLQKQMEHQSERSHTNQPTNLARDDNAESTDIVSRSVSEEVGTHIQGPARYTSSPSPQSQSEDAGTCRLARPIVRSPLRQDGAFTGIENGFEGWSGRVQTSQNPTLGAMQQPRNFEIGQPVIYHTGRSSDAARREQMQVPNRQNGQINSHPQQLSTSNTGYLIGSTPMMKASAPLLKPSLQHRSHSHNSTQQSSINATANTLAAQDDAATASQIDALDRNLMQQHLPVSSTILSRNNAHIETPQHESLIQVNGVPRSRSGPIDQESHSANPIQYIPTSQQFQYNRHLESDTHAQRTQSTPNGAFTTPLWQSRFPQHQISLPVQAQVANPTFYNINQNFYLGHNQVAQSQYTNVVPTIRSNTYPTPQRPVNNSVPITNNIVRSQPQPSFVVPQQQTYAAPRNLPQPPILASNMNMFSGQARASSTYGQKSEPPKRERANMFTSRNTATNTPLGGGTIMGMEDVRRQIEMT